VALVEELATFVAAASTRFTLGTNMFLNHQPDEPDTASSLIELGGTLPEHTFGNDLPSFENARVAFTHRSTSSTKARGDSKAAWVAVQAIVNETLSGVSWLRASAVQSPFLLGRDTQDRVVYRFDVDCMRRTTST